jgi:hypothetical protein
VSTVNDDALLPISRAGLWLLFVLAVANGGFLYLFPQLADTEYAWSITPQVNAAAIGAGYLAGVVATGAGLAAGRWSMVRPLIPGLVVLSLSMLAATAIDGDRFRWDYPPTWVWTAVYVTVPVALVATWRLQGGTGGGAPDDEGTGGGAPDDEGTRGALRPVTGMLGLGLLVIGGLLFVNAGFLLDAWPWELTPLVARVVGGWYLLAGTVLVASLPELRRRRGAPIAHATIASWSAFLLLLPAVYDEGVRDGAELWWWVAAGIVTFAICAWGTLASLGGKPQT